MIRENVHVLPVSLGFSQPYLRRGELGQFHIHVVEAILPHILSFSVLCRPFSLHMRPQLESELLAWLGLPFRPVRDCCLGVEAGFNSCKIHRKVRQTGYVAPRDAEKEAQS